MIDYVRTDAPDASCELRISLERRFDLAALRAVRRTMADAGNLSHLHLDFGLVVWLDAAALRLLADDLAGIEASGVAVVVRRLPAGFATQLAQHPLRRFSSDWFDDDTLFTDPDRERTGFLPSDR